MNSSAFVKVDFFLLIFVSLIIPISIYTYMMWKKAISHKIVLLFGVILVTISGISIFLLQRLAAIATVSPSVLDDRVFVSELSIALYLLPILFAGVGINLISHVLVTHLADANKSSNPESRQDEQAPNSRT